MDGKRVLVAGARNRWSIGWHCAASLVREGAQVAFSVLSEREYEDVAKLVSTSEQTESPILRCDATKPEEVERLYAELGARFDGKLDGLIHSIAYAPREALSGKYVDTTGPDFSLAMSTSVYTLISLTHGARPLMEAAGGGSVVTLTYLGGVRVIPKYNVMGVCKAALESSARYLAYDLGPDRIRVNAVSAGPIKTMAAQGIQGFGSMLDAVADRAPLLRRIGADEVGDTAAFLLSDLSRGITGETVYVDAGYHIMGL